MSKNMFNIYQSLKKEGEGGSPSRRQSDVTGHDRFYQERTRSQRRKRRSINRRSKSASEFDTNAMRTARKRSASIESSSTSSFNHKPWFNNLSNQSSFSSTRSSNASVDEKITNKIDNLAKILFNRISLTKTINQAFRDNNESGNASQSRYKSLDQTPIRPIQYIKMEKRCKNDALDICQVYIQHSNRYNLIKQLSNIGSRVDKYWFTVNDTQLKTDRILTLSPINTNCPLAICNSTKEVLNHLFLVLQHPYVCPILDIEFIEFKEQDYVIIIQPINQGSLKDVIYGVENWNEDWTVKYCNHGCGLALSQIQRMGRQILESLIFLKDRGFPIINHLHSGNIIIQNGVARLAGLENSLLGFTSRIHPIITSKLIHQDAVDSIFFGHMLFEMCTGYELTTFQPSPNQYSDLAKYPQVYNFIQSIFEQTDGYYPTIEELIIHDLFRNIDLRELRNTPMYRPILTPSIVNLLERIQRHSKRGKNNY